jgi:hypothetical protein
MKYRKLRIAWSVAWGVVAVLLCTLWMRSYSRFDTVSCEDSVPPHQVDYALTSSGGHVFFHSFKMRSSHPAGRLWEVREGPARQIEWGNTTAGFKWFRDSIELSVVASHWFFVLVASSLAIVAWMIPRIIPRFSVRALLIATTLVAMGLGVVVWLR